MRGTGRLLRHAATAFGLLAAVMPAWLAAQPVGGWTLPAPDASPTGPVPQGPVDAENPVVRPTAPATGTPRPSSPPGPTSTPVPVIDARPPPPATATAARAPAAPRPEAPAPSPSVAEPAPGNAATVPSPDAPAPTPSTASAPVRSPTPAPAPRAVAGWWWALAAGLALLALALVALLRRHAGAGDADVGDAIEPGEAAPPPAPPAPDRVPEPIPAPIPAPAFARPPDVAEARAEIVFEPVALRLSLVYATLQFRARVVALAGLPAGRLLGDMMSAHASLPREAQLTPPAEALAPLGGWPALATGQTQEIAGELRLPLNAVRPLVKGEAAFLVPLVRLVLLAGDGTDAPLALGRVFTVGVPGAGPALAPLRLDTGPRNVADLAAREIGEARRDAISPLDPARAAG